MTNPILEPAWAEFRRMVLEPATTDPIAEFIAKAAFVAGLRVAIQLIPAMVDADPTLPAVSTDKQILDAIARAADHIGAETEAYRRELLAIRDQDETPN